MKKLSLFFLFISYSWITFAQIDFKAKNFPGKKVELAQAIKNLKEGERLLNQAEKGNDSLYTPALAKLLEAHAFNPDHVGLNKDIAKCLVRMGRFDETIKYYQKLEKIFPHFIPNYLPSYAEALWKNGKYLEAKNIYQKYLDANGSLSAQWEGMPIDVDKRIDEINTFLNESNNQVAREKSSFLRGEKRIPDDAVIAVDPFTEDIYYSTQEDFSFRIVRLERKGNYSLKTAITKNLKNVGNISFMTIHPNGKSILMSNGNDLFILNKFDDDSVTFLPDIVNSNALEPSGVFYKDGILFSSNRDGFMRIFYYNFKTQELNLFKDDILPKYCNIQIASYDEATDRIVYIRDGKGSIGKSDILFLDNNKEYNAGTKINTFDNENWVSYTSTGAFFTTHGDSILRFIRRKEVPYNPVYISGTHLLSFSEKLFYTDMPLGYKTTQQENVVITGEIINRQSIQQPFFIQISNPDSSTIPSTFYKDSLSGQFRAILPRRGKYLIWVHSKDYVPYVKEINAEAIYTGAENLNIELSPIKNGSGFILPFISSNRELTKQEIEQSFELKYLIQWMKDNPKARIQIAVHTDSLNMTPNAIKFGEEKAIGIYNFLKTKDIEKRRLDWLFEGPSSPAYPNNTTQNRALNRRTEIIISTK